MVFIYAAHHGLDNRLFWKHNRGIFTGGFALSSGLRIPSGDAEPVKCYIHYREFLRKSEKTVQRQKSSLKNVSDTSYCLTEWELLQWKPPRWRLPGIKWEKLFPLKKKKSSMQTMWASPYGQQTLTWENRCILKYACDLLLYNYLMFESHTFHREMLCIWSRGKYFSKWQIREGFFHSCAWVPPIPTLKRKHPLLAPAVMTLCL